MVRLAKITKNRLGAPVWAHMLYIFHWVLQEEVNGWRNF